MNIRWSVILGVIALALSAWYYSLNQEQSGLENLIKTPDKPEYIGNQMRTVVFSPEGKQQYVATADKVEYYSQSEHTDFLTPKVYLFDVVLDKNQPKEQQQKQSWKLTAQTATLTKNDMLYLKGNVTAESLSPLSRLQRVETENAVVNIKTQDITSDNQVKINGQNFHSTGLKLVGNLQKQIATLKEQVKTYYEVSNSQ
ncbi:LPS export ABC transporter periplasmic protein LptC [Rodentibacter caecimuris]|uniref:Lipopolysaccharide export system protein LptC n=1 Tax=Rodentibacter caecimuris TaxID=1796644 RepID=A0ABX3L002_9PAST|nr:LPS export ABC transporter periplasmic protein LptC [Rodentibacter heylii]